ncbi:MAG: pyruvate, phosphate dikinase [Lentimicrobiaceae bacterium]|nr:pyruvate, phosphate dikinase [Lentimicrobiaceae bacterium]
MADDQEKQHGEELISLSEVQKIVYERTERLKELSAINQTTQIIREGKPVDEMLQQVCMILPPAWQYPDFTAARIHYDGKDFKTANYHPSQWVQRQSIETIDNKSGFLEVCYLKKFIDYDEGPFLKEERSLINNIAGMLVGYLNSLAAKKIISKTRLQETSAMLKPGEKGSKITSRQLLRTFLNKSNYDRDLYHDLMPFMVREILLVANLYDAYSIEREGRFSEHVLGEYHQLSLTSLPRITGVSNEEEIDHELQNKHYDLIIFMVGVDKKTPVELSEKIKHDYPWIPIYILLNNNNDIPYFKEEGMSLSYIDRVFVWNGESTVFFAMIKLIEDLINIENDTKVGMARVILLVEDSPKYYSRYLPMLYNVVLEQTKHIIEDVTTDELYKVLRMRARPKILLATNYEEAVSIFDQYKDYMLCLITDVKFEHYGKLDADAGIDLVNYVRNTIKELPIVIQSSDTEHATKAYDLKATFIDKNSEGLLAEFRSFIIHYLGFGNFIYRNSEGTQIAMAKTLREFEQHLRTIPDESLLYHAKKDHFSLWLMARGEIQVAKILNPKKITDFSSPSNIREYMIEVIQRFRNEQNKGKIIPFEESAITDESNIVSLADGSLGGKGRGLAFINTLIYNFDFSQLISDIKITAPRTSIIGTEEFQFFMDRNHLREKVYGEHDFNLICQWFLEGKLTETLIRRLKIFLRLITKPIAVRSSGLFEDSLMQPFAGIFETYLLPNNHPDFNIRVEQLMNAIKLVFASVFSKTARGYIEAIHYKIEEEKMAVVLQEVVGNAFDGYFYPHISGVAQSYNYYPFAHMKPDEGFVVAALGLGKYVVEGEKAYRFSPKYPSTEILSTKDQLKNSQVKFFAVDLNKKDINLLEGDTAGLAYLDIDVAEKHGTLRHLASVYDADNQRIVAGISTPGPRIINFVNILKYNYIPLAKTIETVLDVVKEALGTPVEIEFAVDLNKDKNQIASFYLLQIKPLIGNLQDCKVDINAIPTTDILMLSEKGMGNGIITDISDVIYIDKDVFDKTMTMEMACEIEKINEQMIKENKQYILIGPGRWGTRDRWIGIPVTWPQISNAKVIIETSLDDYPLDASSGSHFFHNITSLNIGYFSVQPELSHSFIQWDMLSEQTLVNKTQFFRHVHFSQPLVVKMDGRQRIAVITRK